MRESDIASLLGQIEYRPDWDIGLYSTPGELYLQVSFVDNGKRQSGRKWRISRYMTKSEIVGTAFKACLTAEEHETRERFRYNGVPIYSPHFDVDALAVLATDNCFDVRVDANQGE